MSMYLFKITIGNVRAVREIRPKLTIKKPKRRQWRRSGVFIVKFENISYIILMFPYWPWTTKYGLGRPLQTLHIFEAFYDCIKIGDNVFF